MKKLTYLYLFLLAFALSSCVDDLVEREPEYNLGSENFFNSEGEYMEALIGAYDLLQTTYANNILGEIASDNTVCGGESATDVIGWQQIDDMIHTPVNSNLQDIWNWMFAGVNRCNYILEFQDKTDFEGKEQIIAETRFLRAYYYFELVKWFGPVPLKETRFQSGDETSIPRSSVSDVYAFIEADLQYAVDNLLEFAPQSGRVSLAAAQSLLGKAYLYQEKYQLAAAVLDDVILSENYSLVTNFADIFEHTGENGPESIFEVQYSDAEGAGVGCLQCSEGNVAVGFMGIRNYDGPLYDSGYSFNLPVDEAYNSYEDGDTRRDASILFMQTWAAENQDWNGGEGISYGQGYEHTDYFNRKYLPRKGDQNLGDANLTNPINYRAIRYADVLLMAAEAFNRGNINDEKARTYLNRVRERAFGNQDNNSTASGPALTNEIWEERRLELMGEGHRFFDLVRTGQAAQEINGFTTNKHEIFPIPFEEIQFSNGNWEQNPNY